MCSTVLASNPGFPFRILSRSFLQSCETKSQAFRSGFCLAALEKAARLASNPGFPFRILSRSFLQSCETKSGTESLGSRLVSQLSPKLRDKIRNGKPGFEASTVQDLTWQGHVHAELLVVTNLSYKDLVAISIALQL